MASAMTVSGQVPNWPSLATMLSSRVQGGGTQPKGKDRQGVGGHPRPEVRVYG